MIFPIQQTPSTILGLVCWFDASVTPVGAVSSWTDLSGNKRHAVQATGANQPICTANQRVGRNGLVCTSAASSNLVSNFGNIGPGVPFVTNANTTIFVVAKLNALTTTGNNGFFFDGIDSGNRQSLADLGTSGKFSFASNTATSPLPNADANLDIHTCQGGSTGNYWINGAAQYVNINLGTLGLGGLTINARQAPSAGSISNDANYYEVILYNRKLVTSERVLIQQYLANKWGIAVV